MMTLLGSVYLMLSIYGGIAMIVEVEEPGLKGKILLFGLGFLLWPVPAFFHLKETYKKWRK